MKTITRLLLTLGLAVAALVAPVGTSMASAAVAGQWYDSEGTLRPTVYYTNELGRGNDLTANSAVPFGAVVSDVSFNWSMQSAPPSGTSLHVYLCWGPTDDYCTDVSPSYNTQSYSGSTSDFAGLPADESFHFLSYLASSTKRSLAPNYYQAQSVGITVNYTS
ncbi:flagellar protein FlhE [Modestobacter italicus]|uniref:flagellar protein FlhE n=1 Tax=Modestobacter italicus (strain DSM 44449 / CECT 9708 / BC 501) TaxID=2732864 RepID=UPI001C980665|nr:flagellar protein FlhE [Modestobacter italicus]